MINFENIKIKVYDIYNRIKNWVIYKIHPRSEIYNHLDDENSEIR